MSLVTVVGLAGGGVYRSTEANFGERTAIEPQYDSSQGVVRSTPPPSLSGSPLGMGIPAHPVVNPKIGIGIPHQVRYSQVDCMSDNVGMS